MDDASIVVAYRVIPGANLEPRCQYVQTPFFAITIHRSLTDAGLCSVDGTLFAYTVAAIDIGPKPTSKLKAKVSAERDVCARAMTTLDGDLCCPSLRSEIT